MSAGVAPETQVRRCYDEIWNKVDVSVVPRVLAPDFTFTGDLIADLWVLGDLHGLHAKLAAHAGA